MSCGETESTPWTAHCPNGCVLVDGACPCDDDPEDDEDDE